MHLQRDQRAHLRGRCACERSLREGAAFFESQLADLRLDGRNGRDRHAQFVDAQTHGNIVLGIGQALYEEVVYGDNGELLTDTYSTYPMVKASRLPSFELARTETPTPNNPLGAKGAGDVSNPAVAPAVVNAVCDALSDLGVKNIDMPLKPANVWKALQDADAKVGSR